MTPVVAAERTEEVEASAPDSLYEKLCSTRSEGNLLAECSGCPRERD